MPYLNLDLDYWNHRKTKRLIGLLGRGAEVLPLKLWSYCGKHHAEDGRLAGYSGQEIESIVEWWGQSGQAVAALLTVGFLSQDGADYGAVNWEEHEGHLSAFKRRAKAGAAARWSKIDNASNASSIARPPPEALLGTVGTGRNGTGVKEGSGETSGAPCTVADAVNAAAVLGLPPAEAEAFWNYYAATGWQLGGTPIRAWQPLLTNWKVKWETRRSASPKPSGERQQSIWEKTKRVELITEEIDQIRKRGNPDGFGEYTVSVVDKDRYNALMAERKKLKAEIKGV